MAWLSCWIFIAGDHLISHTVARAVPSAQRGLTSVFGMGTGDPSQYGHRQSIRDIIRDPSLTFWILLKANALKTPQLMMALGGWLPAAFPRRLVCPGWFLPGRVGTRIAIWRQKTLLVRADCNEIDWFIQGLYRRASANCAELILWTSRTGD